jgi:uncharacterized protein DUF6869
VSDDSNIAAAWIKYQRLPNGSAEQSQLFWAYEQLDAMCRSEPAAAWIVIQEIIARDQSDEVLANVGAGPFEDLMVNHGTLLIDKVESCARMSSDFRRMLGVVWQNAISDEVWARLKAIAPPSW